MTDEEEARSICHIETARRVVRAAAFRFLEREVTPEDVAIAYAYAAVDVAQHSGRSAPGAIEWLRTALDVMERQLLADAGAAG